MLVSMIRLSPRHRPTCTTLRTHLPPPHAAHHGTVISCVPVAAPATSTFFCSVSKYILPEEQTNMTSMRRSVVASYQLEQTAYVTVASRGRPGVFSGDGVPTA